MQLIFCLLPREGNPFLPFEKSTHDHGWPIAVHSQVMMMITIMGSTSWGRLFHMPTTTVESGPCTLGGTYSHPKGLTFPPLANHSWALLTFRNFSHYCCNTIRLSVCIGSEMSTLNPHALAIIGAAARLQHVQRWTLPLAFSKLCTLGRAPRSSVQNEPPSERSIY